MRIGLGLGLFSSSAVAALALSPSAPSVTAPGTINFSASGGTGSYMYSMVSGNGSINASTGVYTSSPAGGPNDSTDVVRVSDGVNHVDVNVTVHWAFSSEGTIIHDLDGAVNVKSSAHNPIQNGDSVNEWDDNSGAGWGSIANATQGTAANQPTYVSSSARYNNLPGVTFPAGTSGAALQTGTSSGFATALSSPTTVFVVGDPQTPSSGSNSAYDGIGTDLNRNLFHNSVSGNYTLLENASSISDTFGSNSTVASVFCCIHNAASSKLYRNAKTAVASGTIGTDTGHTGITVGNRKTVSAANSWTGLIMRRLQYSGALSNAAVGRILTKLGSVYGVTIGA